MAGDWIKMRVGLTTNPKVMRLAECLLDDGKYLEWAGLAYGVQGAKLSNITSVILYP